MNFPSPDLDQDPCLAGLVPAVGLTTAQWTQSDTSLVVESYIWL